MIGNTLLTVILLYGMVNTQVFASWIKEDLLPKLPPKSVIVMDNATFHKGKEIKNSITNAGHTLLYLPTYSPDLNPIERKWAESKHARRKLSSSVHELFQYHIS